MKKLSKVNIDTSRKINRDDIADRILEKFINYSIEHNLTYKIMKSGKEGEYISLTGPEEILNKIVIKEFGRDITGQYASTSEFVDGLKQLLKKPTDKRIVCFKDYEYEVLELMNKFNVPVVKIDTTVNWHMHEKSMLLPTGSKINFNVGIENALGGPSGIVAAFAN